MPIKISGNPSKLNFAQVKLPLQPAPRHDPEGPPGGTPGELAGGDAYATSAGGQAEAGTIAQKVVGRLSHPSTNWLTRTYTFLATVGTP